ncbi:MAG TPA: hypothetical protein VHZ81_14585 [Galbitalea sp.]|jgi:hypothetical protein|nr:hypothetical protein [Galbitalea sp.]
MSLGRRIITFASIGALALGLLFTLVGVAPASAASTYTVATAVQEGTTWLSLNDTPVYANEPKLLPGVHNLRLTLTNNTALAVSVTSVDIGIAGAPTTCATVLIQPHKSGSCTVPITVVPGLMSFYTSLFLSNNLRVSLPQHKLIGVTYDLETTISLTTPSGIVSPGDPALETLPLGYRPTATLRITNDSTVAITAVTVPGFNTQTCASILKSISPGLVVICVGIPVTTPASSSLISLTTGAVGNGVFQGDRPGLGVSLSYHGVGGCTTTAANVRAGTAQTVHCTGFEPGITVAGVMHSTPVGLGAHTVAGDGTLDFSFVVPVSTSGGSHSVAIRIGSATIATTPTFNVTAVPQLPETGVDPTAELLVALALLAIGACILLHRLHKPAVG